jgi:hypothetical protein
MEQEALLEKLAREGYRPVRVLPSGVVIGVMPQLYTTGLFVGLNEFSWKRRYCYEHQVEAVIAFVSWDGEGDPPGPWIKEKPSNRLGPGAVGAKEK